MQITGSSNALYHTPLLPRQDDGQGFRPIRPEDMTLSGLMRRISEMNLGVTIDLQA
jgi:hypothetical protein